jgi:hypothetical protein
MGLSPRGLPVLWADANVPCCSVRGRPPGGLSCWSGASRRRPAASTLVCLSGPPSALLPGSVYFGMPVPIQACRPGSVYLALSAPPWVCLCWHARYRAGMSPTPLPFNASSGGRGEGGATGASQQAPLAGSQVVEPTVQPAAKAAGPSWAKVAGAEAAMEVLDSPHATASTRAPAAADSDSCEFDAMIDATIDEVHSTDRQTRRWGG